MRIVGLIALSCVFFVLGSSQAGDLQHGDRTFSRARSDTDMPNDLAAELRRLQQNQAALMAAVNQLITQTAPITLVNPGDASSGYVTRGLVVNAEGFIVPGTIAAPHPLNTLRGTRPGDPLWAEAPPTP